MSDMTDFVGPEVPIFDKLVREGEEKSHVTLPPMFHNFLVGCLVAHRKEIKLFQHRIAVNLLQSSQDVGEVAAAYLMRKGDEALLIYSYFPESALRLNISPARIYSIGQTSYAGLAAQHLSRGEPVLGTFFNAVAENFSLLVKVLRAPRVRFNRPWEEVSWEGFLLFRETLQ